LEINRHPADLRRHRHTEAIVFKRYSSYASLASLALAAIPLAAVGFMAMTSAVGLVISVS
jgi:hypothetical protein